MSSPAPHPPSSYTAMFSQTALASIEEPKPNNPLRKRKAEDLLIGAADRRVPGKALKTEQGKRTAAWATAGLMDQDPQAGTSSQVIKRPVLKNSTENPNIQSSTSTTTVSSSKSSNLFLSTPESSLSSTASGTTTSNGLPPYKYSPTLRPWLARYSETTSQWTYTPDPGSDSCRAYRAIPADRFMWVRLPDNDGARDKTVKDIIRNGLTRKADGIDFHYTFGLATDSKLKSNMVGLFQEGNGITIRNVLSAFGNLQAVLDNDGVGKYIARLGLSFTSTTAVMELSTGVMTEIPDEFARGWKGKGKDKMFTDGCGLISLNAAKAVARELGIVGEDPPSIFQFRMGGQKGILVTYAETDLIRMFPKHCLDGKWYLSLLVRKSQRKHQAPNLSTLEIADWSKPTHRDARLNESLVHILASLGVETKDLQELLSHELKRLKQITADVESAEAYLESRLASLDSLEMSPKNIAYRMLKAGISLNDPYLAMNMRILLNGSMKSLREKLAIPVPDSRMLFGCVDEQDLLEENEVYVHSGLHGSITGDVVVTRFPNAHPGDVLILQAVKPPPSEAPIRDAIVFSQRGRQPVPDRMSGGDLDGDKYWCSWSPLVKPKTTFPPDRRINPPKEKKPKTGESKDPIKEMAAYVPSRLGDTELGKTANIWKAVANEALDGARNPKCIALAQQMELLVDVAKAGHEIPKMPDYVLKRDEKRGRDNPSVVQILKTMIGVAHESEVTDIEVDPDLEQSHTESDDDEDEADATRTADAVFRSQCITEFHAMFKRVATDVSFARTRCLEKVRGIDLEFGKDGGERQRTQAWQSYEDAVSEYVETERSAAFGGKVIRPNSTRERKLKLRASVFYSTGYAKLRAQQIKERKSRDESQEKKSGVEAWKMSLCWLGLPFLCQLKADAIAYRTESFGPAASVAPRPCKERKM